MNIGVVAYEMEGASTGVGRYLEGLLGGLRGQPQRHEWRLFFKGHAFEHPLWSDGDGRFEAIFDGRPKARPILWEQARLPFLLRRFRLDALFSPAYSLPWAPNVPKLVTLHDLSFEHLPEEFPVKERLRRRYLARRAAQQARRVLTDTGAVASDLEQTYGVERGKIGIVPLAVEKRFTAAPAPDDESRLEALGLRSPYLLYTGSILPRRRLDLVIEAFAAVAGEHPSLRLVIAGNNRLRHRADLRRWVAESGCRERIDRIGYAADEDLPALYRHAEASVYLSTYEGFGLPPLESLACGTPAVVSPGLALDDLWPEYPYRLSALEPEELRQALCGALSGSSPGIIAEAIQRLSCLTWEKAAERFLGELELAVPAGPTQA